MTTNADIVRALREMALFLEMDPARHVLPVVQSHAGPFPW